MPCQLLLQQKQAASTGARLLAVFYFPEFSPVNVSRSPELQCCWRMETQARSQNQKINTEPETSCSAAAERQQIRALRSSGLSRPQPGTSPHPRPRGPAQRRPAAHSEVPWRRLCSVWWLLQASQSAAAGRPCPHPARPCSPLPLHSRACGRMGNCLEGPGDCWRCLPTTA